MYYKTYGTYGTYKTYANAFNASICPGAHMSYTIAFM